MKFVCFFYATSSLNLSRQNLEELSMAQWKKCDQKRPPASWPARMSLTDLAGADCSDMVGNALLGFLPLLSKQLLAPMLTSERQGSNIS